MTSEKKRVAMQDKKTLSIFKKKTRRETLQIYIVILTENYFIPLLVKKRKSWLEKENAKHYKKAVIEFQIKVK